MMKIDPKKLFKLNDYLGLLLTAGILTLLNYLFTLLPLRLDLTAAKSYSLSAQTKTILKNLDDVVNIKVFLSTDLPARMKAPADQLKDVLKEYERLSLRKIRIKYIDPGTNPALLQEAQSMGIPQLQFSQIESETFQVSQGFFGLALLYGDKMESWPIVDSTAGLEYELTSRLAKLTREQAVKIAFTTGHEEDSAYDNLSIINQLLEQEYEVGIQPVNTESGSLLGTDNNLLIIAGPKTPFSGDEAYLLDQYLMQGKSILLLGGGTTVADTMQAVSYDNGLNDWLTHFGFTLKNNLVLDSSSEIANFNAGLTTFLVPYPFWVKVLPDNISDHPAMTGLETVMLPWASSLEIKEEVAPQPVVLVKSTSQAWEQTGLFNLDPTQDYKVMDEDLKQFNLAVLAEGKLTSAYQADNAPEGYNQADYIGESDMAKLTAVSSSQFITDNFIDRFRANALFLQNLVEYLASDIDLSGVRTKGESVSPLRQLPDTIKSVVKYANMAGPSLIAALIGLIYLSKRKDGRQK